MTGLTIVCLYFAAGFMLAKWIHNNHDELNDIGEIIMMILLWPIVGLIVWGERSKGTESVDKKVIRWMFVKSKKEKESLKKDKNT